MILIYRKKKSHGNFFQMDKEVFEEDCQLSYKAIGILSYMLSRPDNWVFYHEEIEKHSSDGRRAIKSGIEELVDWGYLQKKEGHKSGYDVYESRFDNKEKYPDEMFD